MPIYEYMCDQCGERFDKWLRSFSGTEDVHCPKCGSLRVSNAVSLCGKSGSQGDYGGAGDSCAPSSGG
jgi:putative FmdB family regulatory protein